jgi:hypothetical protein
VFYAKPAADSQGLVVQAGANSSGNSGGGGGGASSGGDAVATTMAVTTCDGIVYGLNTVLNPFSK